MFRISLVNTQKIVRSSSHAIVFNHRYLHGTGGGNAVTNTIVNFVPQQEAWIVERFGKYLRTLQPGLALLVPFIDKIKYTRTLKEVPVEIPAQSAITKDNVAIQLDGVLYYKVVDPYKACYGVEYPQFAVGQLAMTTMRSEIGKLTLDKTFEERTLLNQMIVESLNVAASDWGIRCLRYEIRDIQLPPKVLEAMHMQVAAERRKRAQILESEGSRNSAINIAEGEKQSQILKSEAIQQEQINLAEGEASAILARARASAAALERVATAIQSKGGSDAVSMTIAEKYISAFGELAKEGTTVLLPANSGDISSMVTQAMSVFNTLKKTSKPLSLKSVTNLSDNQVEK